MNGANHIVSLAFRGLVRLYQWLIAPILPSSCRYYPSCSNYALEALRVHGGLAGAWLATKRILRCHPWGGGGVDPVPGRAARR